MNHKTENNNTVAWIALAVAIVSASLSLVQYLENLKQNAILLAPNLSIISEKGRTLKQGLYLQNTGFGPAEIVSFRVRFMGSEIPDLQHINDELVDSEEVFLEVWAEQISNCKDCRECRNRKFSSRTYN